MTKTESVGSNHENWVVTLKISLRWNKFLITLDPDFSYIWENKSINITLPKK